MNDIEIRAICVQVAAASIGAMSAGGGGGHSVIGEAERLFDYIKNGAGWNVVALGASGGGGNAFRETRTLERVIERGQK